MDEPHRPSPLAIAVIVVALFIPALYVAGYFAMSKPSPGATPEDRCRIFRSRWLTTIYKPAAKVEGTVTGDT